MTNMKCITKGQMYSYIKPWIGEGLIISSGEFKNYFAVMLHCFYLYITKLNILVNKLKQFTFIKALLYLLTTVYNKEDS